jgi:RNA polymerase sigma-70 factor (ECF subfamily)
MEEKSKQEFIKIVNQHIRIAHKVCSIYGNGEEEKKDLLQEMMYQLWKSFGQFDNQSKFSTWMYSVCLNTALTYRRKEQKHQNESLSENHFHISEENNPEKEQEINLLLQAIGTLSPLNKAIILLYLEELSYQEIAEITGLTKSNISVKLVRIKKELEYIMKTKPTIY